VKTLCLHDVSFYGPNDNNSQGYWHCREGLPLSDDPFLQNIPKLEYLYLEWMTVDGKFAGNLRHCQKLQELRTNLCYFEEFIPALTNTLADPKALPSLRRLRLLSSQTGLDGNQKKDFTDHCTVQRPEIAVTYVL
jgi:hypothetical protein